MHPSALTRRSSLALCAVVLAATVAACGSDNGAGSQVKTIGASAMKDAKGDVTFCLGKDTSGDKTAAIKAFNEAYPQLHAKLLQFSTSADNQRAQFVQRQEAGSGECDLFYSDVIWTAEFASQHWIYDMTPYVNARKDELIPATLDTVRYDGKLWGIPQQTDAAFLYYRTDQVTTPPKTWQDVYRIAEAKHGIVYQGAPYEGLTCDFLELAYAAGGKVLSADGKHAAIDSPENLAALQFMVDGVKNGAAANGVRTYMEEESRRYWESGRATFMRNWPYAYALDQKKGSHVRGKFAVMPFPPFKGGGRAAILGGHNLVISVFSKNPGAALKLADFLTSREQQLIMFRDYSLAPTLKAVYDDPSVKRKYDFTDELRQSVSQAKARPVSPVYPQISQAIYRNVNEALAGRVTPKQALQTAQKEMQDALNTF